jgi:hypothetical protein
MQLKRLRKTGAAASQPADDSRTTQDISESQLLRDLEDLTGGLAADDSGDAGHAAALAAAAPAARCTATPAVGTSRRARRSGVASSGKRQRREFKPLFGSQDNELQQSDGGLGLGNSTVQQEQVNQTLSKALVLKHGCCTGLAGAVCRASTTCRIECILVLGDCCDSSLATPEHHQSLLKVLQCDLYAKQSSDILHTICWLAG